MGVPYKLLDQRKNEADPPPLLTVPTLGVRIRELRLDRRLTIEELAAKASVSAGLLSQLERGQGNPSFNTLVQIAHALAVPITELFQPEPTGSPVVRAAERQSLSLHDGAPGTAANFLLTPTANTTLEAVLVEVPPGYSSEETPFVHEGEEFGFILEGRHEVHLGDTCYTLEPGDSITYSSRIPHWYRNAGDTPVRSIWVITPPTW